MFELFDIDKITITKYLFFTGKGGVGKTSTACAIAVALADKGKRVMLVSTDPASNLQDVFNTELNNKGVGIKEVPNLIVANFEPEVAAREYRESVVAPYRGKLPESVIKNMTEQLSGSCTVEIAAFNEFTHFITNQKISNAYDHIIFDTAPTGHTLRMLQLPSAWTDFIDNNKTGASCLGQLSGLTEKKAVYKNAVDTLVDGNQTTLVLISRAEESPMLEVARASMELRNIGIENQILIINGVLGEINDTLSKSMANSQQQAMRMLPKDINKIDIYKLLLKPFNIIGIEAIRGLLNDSKYMPSVTKPTILDVKSIDDIVEDIYLNNKKVIFAMGKGGVGKTTMAAAIAMKLAAKGEKVHLTTTDPAAHVDSVVGAYEGITISHIDEKAELEKYKEDVLSEAKQTMSKDDLDYIMEDLRSPCTQEIAVFRAFAEVINRSEEEIVVVDTAPTGHTLLLLDSTQSYHKEIERSKGSIPESVIKLLPKLRDKNHTEVIILTLPEATPVHEAKRLQEDLERAGLHNKWWLINNSLYQADTTNSILMAKGNQEATWINKIHEYASGNVGLIPYIGVTLKGDRLLLL
ncbi:MAG: arsenical pump-driving ATPase [Acidaminobacteraceae bacterium]